MLRPARPPDDKALAMDPKNAEARIGRFPSFELLAQLPPPPEG